MVIPQPVCGGSSCGQWGQGASVMVAAGVGRMFLLCRGVSMASGSPGHLPATMITPWVLLLWPFLSQTLFRGTGNGGEGRREQPILAQASSVDTPGGDHSCHNSVQRQGPSPCYSPASLKRGPAPRPMRCQETWALSSCPHTTTPPASPIGCCSPWKFAIFPLITNPAQRWV